MGIDKFSCEEFSASSPFLGDALLSLTSLQLHLETQKVTPLARAPREVNRVPNVSDYVMLGAAALPFNVWPEYYIIPSLGSFTLLRWWGGLETTRKGAQPKA